MDMFVSLDCYAMNVLKIFDDDKLVFKILKGRVNTPVRGFDFSVKSQCSLVSSLLNQQIRFF